MYLEEQAESFLEVGHMLVQFPFLIYTHSANSLLSLTSRCFIASWNDRVFLHLTFRITFSPEIYKASNLTCLIESWRHGSSTEPWDRGSGRAPFGNRAVESCFYFFSGCRFLMVMKFLLFLLLFTAQNITVLGSWPGNKMTKEYLPIWYRPALLFSNVGFFWFWRKKDKIECCKWDF